MSSSPDNVVQLSREGRVAVITVNSPPVNALSYFVREGLMRTLRAAQSDPDIHAIVLVCGGRTFFAGADISEFGKQPQAPSLRDVHSVMEASAKPVVAAIHGTALGGGLETALAAHYRLAVPSAKMGLPEVKLGLIPGAGGTQRLPRLVGAHRALEMITSGAQIGAKEALSFHLIDEIVDEGGLKDAAIVFAEGVIGKTFYLLRDGNIKLDDTEKQSDLFANFKKTNARKFRDLAAPEAGIEAVEGAVSLPFDKGMALERALFEKLVAGPQSKALRYAFFAERAASKVHDIPEGTRALPISHVGVVGAGTMGGGIAMNFANAGMPVTIVDLNHDALGRGLAVIKKNYETSAQRGRFTPDEATRNFSLISGALSLEDLAACDVVIEAVFELMGIKKDLFGKLDTILKPDAILASNTSYLDLNEIANSTARPESVAGLHFFSPANVMKLVEVVRGAKTSNEVMATAMMLTRTIGKIGVLVGVGPGFVGNRMLKPRQREAEKLLLQGVMPWTIDRVLTEFGMPMGPFQMRDLAGLDLGWVKAESNGATINEVLCESGRFGQKVGAGYYDYDAARKPSPSPVTEKIIEDFVGRRGGKKRGVSDQEVLERLLYASINEGARILEEKIAHRVSDIDVVWLNGYGFPRHRGGPMYYADTVGLPKIVARIREFAARDGGTDWTVAPMLDQLATGDGSFIPSSS